MVSILGSESTMGLNEAVEDDLVFCISSKISEGQRH